jgi:hypothetical protein
MPSGTRLLLVFFLILLAPFLSLPNSARADDVLRPYILIDEQAAPLEEQATLTRSALTGGGFEVVGDYSPYPGARVIAFTHPALLEAAAQERFGGYAAVLRLGLTEVDGSVQRSYANPAYWGTALQVGSLDAVSSALDALFRSDADFGSKKGLTAKKLEKYRYMMMMPRLRDHDLLASFDSHQAALETIRANLAGNDDLTGVFEVAVPGTEEVLFGIGIGSGDGADATVMAITDQDDPRHTAHLPYAMLVSGSEVYALAGKFRIALAFPDLGMGTFMKISGAPNAIRDSLARVAGAD